MEEKTGNVYRNSADKINRILKETGLSQAALCRLLPGNNADGQVDRTFFNQVKNGKKRLTPELAQNIIDTVNKSLPPDQRYRLDWLLGKDEYKTQQDYLQSISGQLKDQEIRFHSAEQALNFLIGGSVVFNEADFTVAINGETYNCREYYRLMHKTMDFIRMELSFMYQAKNNAPFSAFDNKTNAGNKKGPVL